MTEPDVRFSPIIEDALAAYVRQVRKAVEAEIMVAFAFPRDGSFLPDRHPAVRAHDRELGRETSLRNGLSGLAHVEGVRRATDLSYRAAFRDAALAAYRESDESALTAPLGEIAGYVLDLCCRHPDCPDDHDAAYQIVRQVIHADRLARRRGAGARRPPASRAW